MRAAEQRAVDLIAWARSRPAGFTKEDAMQHFGWGENTFARAKSAARTALSLTGENLVANPRGQYFPWVYELVSHYSDARSWLLNRVSDSETRITTINNVVGSLVNASQPGTLAGDKARLIQLHLTRLQQDVANLQRQYLP